MSLYNPFSKKHRKQKANRLRLASAIQTKSIHLQNIYTQNIISESAPGTGNACNDNIIVTLTSFADRLSRVALTIESLMQQTLKADQIQLWLGADKISPDDIPYNLRLLEKRGLEICFGEQDVGPYTKYFYALRDNPNSLILTVDDDILYPHDMIEKLYRAYLKDKDVIHCHRGHKISLDGKNMLPYKKWKRSDKKEESSLLIFPTGVGGVLYFPGSLDEDALNKELFLKLCPNADDVWLKAMSLKKNVKCHTLSSITPFMYDFPNIPFSQEVTLKRKNKQSNGNDEKIKNVFDHYSLIDKLC